MSKTNSVAAVTLEAEVGTKSVLEQTAAGFERKKPDQLPTPQRPTARQLPTPNRQVPRRVGSWILGVAWPLEIVELGVVTYQLFEARADVDALAALVGRVLVFVLEGHRSEQRGEGHPALGHDRVARHRNPVHGELAVGTRH